MPHRTAVRIVYPDFEFEKDIATIANDLVAKSDETYEVVASRVKEGDPKFHIPLKSSLGDIGTGKYARNGRRFLSEYRKDPQKDFVGGTKYSVEITSRWMQEAGGGAWVYYVWGGVSVAVNLVFLTCLTVSEASTALTSQPPTATRQTFLDLPDHS